MCLVALMHGEKKLIRNIPVRTFKNKLKKEVQLI